MSALEKPNPNSDDESLLDSDLVRNLLQILIAGTQSEIEYTSDDATRIRQKGLLRAAQRLNRHLKAVMKGQG